jgi:enoyl-CoA hydratase/carnithine racemase
MDSILYEIRPDHVATIGLNRPQSLNALTWEAMEDFSSAVDRAADDSSLRAVVIYGAGEAFCSGGDLYQLHTYPTLEDGQRLSRIMGDALAKLEAMPVPSIAAIEGPALGGGAELALACDLRVMAEGASLGMMHIKLGIAPAWGGAQRLLRLVGYARAIEWLTLGVVHTAEQAATHGLANQVTDKGAALAQALALASRMAELSAMAVRAVKASLRAGLTESLQRAADIERQLFAPLWASTAHLEASARFVARRSRHPSPNGQNP